jgi:hypothetical protein
LLLFCLRGRVHPFWILFNPATSVPFPISVPVPVSLSVAPTLASRACLCAFSILGSWFFTAPGLIKPASTYAYTPRGALCIIDVAIFLVSVFVAFSIPVSSITIFLTQAFARLHTRPAFSVLTCSASTIHKTRFITAALRVTLFEETLANI